MRIIILFFLFVLRFRLYIYQGWVRGPNLTLVFLFFFLNNIFWLCSKAARLCMLTESQKRGNTSDGNVCSSAINTVTPMHTFFFFLANLARFAQARRLAAAVGPAKAEQLSRRRVPPC